MAEPQLDNYNKALANHEQVKKWIDEVKKSHPDIYAVLVDDPHFELLERRNMEHPERSKAVGWLMNEYYRLLREKNVPIADNSGLFSGVRAIFKGSR